MNKGFFLSAAHSHARTLTSTVRVARGGCLKRHGHDGEGWKGPYRTAMSHFYFQTLEPSCGEKVHGAVYCSHSECTCTQLSN